MRVELLYWTGIQTTARIGFNYFLLILSTLSDSHLELDKKTQTAPATRTQHRGRGPLSPTRAVGGAVLPRRGWISPSSSAALHFRAAGSAWHWQAPHSALMLHGKVRTALYVGGRDGGAA